MAVRGNNAPGRIVWGLVLCVQFMFAFNPSACIRKKNRTYSATLRSLFLFARNKWSQFACKKKERIPCAEPKRSSETRAAHILLGLISLSSPVDPVNRGSGVDDENSEEDSEHRKT